MKYVKYITFIFLLFLTPNVFAEDLSSVSYSQKSTFTGSGKYDYSTNNLMGDDYSVVSTGNIGTTYNGKAYYFQFNFHKQLQPNSTYNLKISSSTNDFTNKISLDYVTALCYNSFSSEFNTKECNTGIITINSVTRGSISNGQSKNFTIQFTTGSTTYSYWGFKIAGGMYNLSGVSTFKVSSITLNSIESNNTQDIINNNNQNSQNIIDNSIDNTNNIINNNNQNTQDIIDNQNELLGNKCPNLFDKSHLASGGIYSDGSIVNNMSLVYTDYYIDVEPNTTYTFSANSNVERLVVAEYNSSKSFIQRDIKLNGSTYTITTTSNTKYVRLNSVITAVEELQFQKGSSRTAYCEFGSYLSKLDDTTNAINETNQYLKDNSDPYISDNDFLTMFNSIGFNDPLQNLLQLPVQFINALVSQSNTCQAVNLGTLWGVSLTLPCINLQNLLGSTVWTTIDVLMSIGLLVVIIKNLYQTFANLLTMGGEKEAREKFNMPTPMEFLSMILGGDR